MSVTNQDRIDAAQKALDESTKLYDEGKKKYDASLALYEKTKASYNSAQTVLSTLQNTNLDTTQVLQLAAANVPDPRTYAQAINQPGADPQKILEEQRNIATKNLNLSKREKDKAEKEVQKDLKFINGIKDKISVVKKQLGIVTSSVSLKNNATKQKLTKEARIKQNKQKINWNDTQALIRKNKGVIKAVAKAAVLYSVALVINNQLKALSESVQRLSELVDKTNDIIQSANTKQDILKAKIARDAALVTLNNAESQLIPIRNSLNSLQTILTILSLLLSVILLIPIPPFTPLKITQKVINAILTIDAIAIYVGIAAATLASLVSEVEYQKSRLLPLSDVIDQAINNDLTPEEINTLLNRPSQYGKLGPLSGVVYKGFTFAIYEENDPKYVVAGNKRRYAVALDRSGFATLYSQPSFTLDPEVLVEELKLKIDEQNLKP